jgi:hypothetical protein
MRHMGYYRRLPYLVSCSQRSIRNIPPDPVFSQKNPGKISPGWWWSLVLTRMHPHSPPTITMLGRQRKVMLQYVSRLNYASTLFTTTNLFNARKAPGPRLQTAEFPRSSPAPLHWVQGTITYPKIL